MADPFDSVTGAQMRDGGDIDSKPLKFGKYRGTKAELAADIDPRYMKWAYENVGNFDVISEALYRSIGGKGKRAERKERPAATPKPTQRRWDQEQEAGEERKPRPKTGFDDLDDDIPF